MKWELYIYTSGGENLRIRLNDLQGAINLINRIQKFGGYWSNDQRSFFPYHAMTQFEIRENRR